MKLRTKSALAATRPCTAITRFMVGAAAISMCTSLAAAAKPAPEAEPDDAFIGYYLPMLGAEVTGSFRLVACDAQKAQFKSEFTLVQKFVPDPYAQVRIDTNVGFLAKRSVKVEHYPDGTLKAFNGSWEGQGGKVVSAAVKLASSFAGLPLSSFQEGTPSPSRCGEAVDNHLALLANIESYLTLIESRLAISDNLAAELRARDVLLQKKAEILKVLTVSKTWPVAIPYGLAGTCTPDTPVPGKPNYTPLFGNVDHSGFPAVNGIRVKLCRTTGFSAENLAAAAIQTALEDKQEDLIYRVPVPGQLTVSINGWSGGEAQSKSFAINVPQWAGLSRLRLGKGGLFGSREAAAKFDAMGMPSELSYGSGGGADDIAGLIDTGREGVKALGNAELTRLQAEIALEEARQKLEALRASSDTASE